MPKKNSPKLPPVSEGTGPSKSERRAAAAAQAREQERRARRRNVLIQVAVGAAVVLLVVVGTVAFLANRDSGAGPGSGSASDAGGAARAAAVPPSLTADGAVRFGAQDAAVTVQVVEDFQCPACRQFETVAGDLLASYEDSAEVAVEYRPIAFLDQMSSTDYSSRALNASMCVLADAGAEAWRAYATDLFAEQPAEGGDGLSDEQLVSMAEDAGAGASVASCVEDRPYDEWAQDTTRAAFDDGVSGTPTVFVNGEPLDRVDPETIQAAVDAALAR